MSSSQSYTSTLNESSCIAEMNTCNELITALSSQIQAQMDVNTNYILLQRQLERSHHHSLEMLEGVTRRTKEMDIHWTKCISEMLNIRDDMIQNAEKQTKYSSSKMTPVKNKEKTKEWLKDKNKFVEKNLGEINKIQHAVKEIHSRTKSDERRLQELESKAKDLETLDNNISKSIQRELQTCDEIKKANKRAGNYGVCELTTGYRQLMRQLSSAIDILEQLKSKSTKKQTPIPTLSLEELKQLLTTLRKIAIMVKLEITASDQDNRY